MNHKRAQSLGEEIANSITHGLGLAASLVGLPILVVSAIMRNDAWQIVGGSVFAVALVALYAASTMYHALPQSRAKRVCQVLDHMAIYLLIAGTYTPFTLGVLRGPWGWTMFGLIWGLAVMGIFYKGVWGMRFLPLSTAIYVLMGWLAVIAIQPMLTHLPVAGIGWLLAGGLLYTGGVVFFALERLRYSHTIWHLFVLGGSVCHFFAVLWYAAPASA